MSKYQYYKGINHPMPEEYKDTPKAIFWMAEEGFANSLREERTLFEL